MVVNYHKAKPVIKIHKLEPYFKDIEKRLTKSMGTKVILKPKAKNKGRIEIEYYSAEELERILDYLNMEE
jgi:ParB family chromosome partitioning protein